MSSRCGTWEEIREREREREREKERERERELFWNKDGG